MTKLAALASCALLFALVLAPSPSLADPIGLLDTGAAGQYAVLAIGGTSTTAGSFAVYQSGTVVNGNVGAGPYVNWTHGIDATINGPLDYDTTDTLPAITGTITGGTHQINMSAAVSNALSASAAYAALTPTATVSTLTEGETLNLAHGLNVIQITGDVALKTTLAINGFADSSVVFQLISNDGSPVLNLNGVDMSLTGGITSGNVLWDVNGFSSQKNDVVIQSGAIVYGTFLAPDRNMEVDQGNVFGQLIAGGDNIQPGLEIHSSSQITFAPVPEPASLPLFGSGLTLLAATLRKRNRRSAS